MKGYTLIEVLIAVAIAGIVIASAFPELDKRNYHFCGFSCK